MHTGNENVVVMELDLSSLDNVRNFVAEFTKKESKLDVLINNAGIPGAGEYHFHITNYFKKFLLTIFFILLINYIKPIFLSGFKGSEGFEQIFLVNYLSHFLLTHLLKGNFLFF